MKLQLIFPAWCSTFGVFKNIAKKASSFPPLGLCYIAAIAQKAGWDSQIVDGEVESLTTEGILERISSYRPDLIGLTATTPFFHRVTEVARAIKENFQIPIILGGPHPSLTKEEAFLDVFDYLFIGECELTFPDFLKDFSSGGKGESIPGIMRREKGAILYGGISPRVQHLDSIPWPARELLPYKKYFVGTLKGVKNYTSLFMSRGCPFQCVFCASDLYGKEVRRRMLPEVIKEIDYIVNTLGIKHIYFLDDTLTLNRKFVMDLCQEIKRNKLIFTFEGSTRANLWDEELVKEMKDCGLIRMSFGLETADLNVRKIIKKEIPLESYIVANKINKKYGIETINSVMLGLPGETRQSIKTTIDFLCKAREIQHATYSIAMPYPGTDMLRMAKNKEHGLKLVDEDFAHFQRYGSAVMDVSDIKPEELIYLQKKGLFRIYSCWWRLLPILKRHGLRALLHPVFDALGTVCKWFVFHFSRKKPTP